MKANHSPMSVADYCQAIKANKIKVNEQYQRKEGLWNNHARSFFIESLLLEYPIPKLFLYARLDLKTRETIKEIVDGQQRSQALVNFFENKLALSSKIETEELRGLKYNRLSEEWQTKFLSYPLPIDQFSGVTEQEVRETFRRINANNVPLNAEEQRNAEYQGPFKWFIVSIAEQYSEVLLKLGVFTRRDLIRMVDLRLYAEIIITIESGFTTVKGSNIDKLYKKYNAAFENEERYRQILTSGVEASFSSPEILADQLLRSHILQSYIVALIDKQFSLNLVGRALEVLPEWLEQNMQPPSIEVLLESLGAPVNFPTLRDFTNACTQATNTAASKATRFLYFRHALG